MKIKIKKERLFVGLSLLRIVLAFVIGLLIVNNKRDIAVIVFIAGALIAFFESLAAQKLIKGLLLESALGFFADRIMINASVIALAFAHLIPFWVMIVFLAKDAVTFGIALTLYYRDYRREFKPTALGKITLFFQVIALIPPMMEGTDWVLMWIAIVITMAAGTESLFKSEFRLVRKKREMDDFRITRLVKFADVFTLTNVVFGIISILFAVKGWYNTASFMLILAVVSDYFDGKLAKATGQQNEFGKQLDSLADTVSFGVAPAIFGFTLIQTPLALMSFTIFLFCGILRLARYNIMNLSGGFRGMPITWNGLIIPLLYFSRNVIGLEIRHFPYIYLVLGILMVSSIKIKRLF